MDLDEIEMMATRQAEAYAKMCEFGEGIGGLAVRRPTMGEDMRRWDDATENHHADTVLKLVGALRAVLALADSIDDDIRSYEIRDAVDGALSD